jgi:hypothetical protein
VEDQTLTKKPQQTDTPTGLSPVGAPAEADQADSKSQTGDLSDVIIAGVVAAILYCGLLWFALSYQEGKYTQILVLSGITAAALGWIFGIMISPYNSGERSAFSEHARLVYGFVTGYVISKLDPLLTRLIETKSGQGLDQRLFAVALFAIASFLIAIGVTYISRSYWVRKSSLNEGKLSRHTKS